MHIVMFVDLGKEDVLTLTYYEFCSRVERDGQSAQKEDTTFT